MSDYINSDLHGLISFRLDRLALALPVETVREVVPIARLAHPPQLPRAVHGILNLGGEAVPVLRLDRLLGLADCGYDLSASILIMRGEPALGLLVSHVDGVRTAGDFAALPVPPERTLNGCLLGILASGTAELHLLSWNEVLMAEERRRLAEFAARAQARVDELLTP
ncbi:MAG: chemotaxis protein CheW [Magnetospirillum sp.]|nr:chemotaxis protein CheW [Magnetospirillum sp.]